MVTPEVIASNRPAGGMIFENSRAALKPPPGREAEGEDHPYGPPSPSTAVQSVALDPRILKYSLGAIANAAAHATGYPGWALSADELEAIAESLAGLGVTLPPVYNCILISVSILAGKAMGYVLWVKGGKQPLNKANQKIMQQGKQEWENDVAPLLGEIGD